MENFYNCKDQVKAIGFSGCSNGCNFVASLAICLESSTSSWPSCPGLKEALLKKTKKMLVRMEASTPGWDGAACPAAVTLKSKYPSLDCSEADKQFTECHAQAYTTYQTELAAGGDGRPDYVERKTCNWITETFQNCHDAMVATRCKTHSDLNALVDAGLHSIITNLEATQPAWDSSLCPTASAHLVRWEEGREAREARAREASTRDSWGWGLTSTKNSISQAMCRMIC